MWVRLRTTNVIERTFRELRKRTRSMYFSANEASCNRIIYALFINYNKKREEHLYGNNKKNLHKIIDSTMEICCLTK